MGVRAEIQDEVRKETVTKIHGQPTNQDLTILNSSQFLQTFQQLSEEETMDMQG